MECASHPPLGAPFPLGAPLLSLSFLSFLSSLPLWCNPKASTGAAAQRTSLPSFPLPFSKSLSLFSLHFQRHVRRGEARERRALRHNWGLFLSWKKGTIASHLLLSPLYCTILKVGGWVSSAAQCLDVLKGKLNEAVYINTQSRQQISVQTYWFYQSYLKGMEQSCYPCHLNVSWNTVLLALKMKGKQSRR